MQKQIQMTKAQTGQPKQEVSNDRKQNATTKRLESAAHGFGKTMVLTGKLRADQAAKIAGIIASENAAKGVAVAQRKLSGQSAPTPAVAVDRLARYLD
jgi:2-phospho-L-lactate guanylyltransferase (CobY/MobA/RfbA family)